MRPYSADDADHFQGRGVEIEELLGRLRAGEREICVIGPSSGKSSLVTAGLLQERFEAAHGEGRRSVLLLDESHDLPSPRIRSPVIAGSAHWLPSRCDKRQLLPPPCNEPPDSLPTSVQHNTCPV
jgi:hypothetical protein